MTKISKKIGKMWKDMTGVSPIIAVILMVAITVVLAATIYVWVSGFGGSGGTSAAISMRQTNFVDGTTSNEVDYQILDVKGGLGWEDIKIVVNGEAAWTGDGSTGGTIGTGFTLVTGAGSGATMTTTTTGAIHAGDVLKISDDGTNVAHGNTVTILDVDSDSVLWSGSITY